MSESVTLKSYFYEVLIPSSQKNTSSPIEDILHHVSISFMKKLALYKCFNPRTHTGCDFIRFRISISSSVSIHAPTRGATSNDNCFLNATRVSIHAPTRGATDRYVWPVNSSLFQSTHPHGVRPFSSSLVQDVKSFNPRTHTGCDAAQTKKSSADMFQSTHPHGVRLAPLFISRKKN